MVNTLFGWFVFNLKLTAVCLGGAAVLMVGVQVFNTIWRAVVKPEKLNTGE